MNIEKDRKISVIVPIYNAENCLDDCLETLTGQTYENLEILLIDDGSKDNSAAVCRLWCEKDQRIRLLQQENQGVSAARNRGLDQASGEYIAFVDADDWIAPDMLERQMECLLRGKCDMVLCGFREVTEADREDLQKAIGSGRSEPNPLWEQNSLPEKNLRQNDEMDSPQILGSEAYAEQYLFRGNTRCWSILFSRNAVGAVRFRTGLTIGEDMLFLADLLERIERVAVMEDRLYCYYQNSAGAMFSAFKASYMDQITCWQLVRKQMEDKKPSLLPLINVCLFQAILLTAGKLALSSSSKMAGAQMGNSGIQKKGREHIGYLTECHTAARQCWNDLGCSGRKNLPLGYRIKGPIFLVAPHLYLKLYHLWKGSN